MSLFTTTGTVTKLWPGGALPPGPGLRAAALERNLRIFFEIAAATELTPVEQRILLDITARELALVRLVPGNALALCGTKLERRVDYAIPILQRMADGMAS